MLAPGARRGSTKPTFRRAAIRTCRTMWISRASRSPPFLGMSDPARTRVQPHLVQSLRGAPLWGRWERVAHTKRWGIRVGALRTPWTSWADVNILAAEHVGRPERSRQSHPSPIANPTRCAHFSFLLSDRRSNIGSPRHGKKSGASGASPCASHAPPKSGGLSHILLRPYHYRLDSRDLRQSVARAQQNGADAPRPLQTA